MDNHRKNVTIEQIAEKIGVCKSTVSKALSNATDINENTRDRILACASEMGYIARRSNEKYKRSVTVFVYNMNYSTVNQFAYDLVMGFQAAAAEANYGVNVVSISTEEMHSGDYASNLGRGSSEGYFIIGFQPHERVVDEAEKRSIPLVVLDNYIDSPMVTEIGCDNLVGYRMLIGHLSRLGHRRIAFMGGEQRLPVTAEREAAFISAMEKNKLRVYRKLISYGSYYSSFDKSKIIDLIDNGATAIVCASDNIAAETVKACQNVGLRVPHDVSVTGFDGLPFTKYTSPPITTIVQNRIQMGKTAFGIIMNIRSGSRLSRIVLRPEIIVRESTCEYRGE